MADNLTITETDDGDFVLTQGDQAITLTQEALMGLKASLDTWQDRQLQSFQTGSGQVHPVVTIGVTSAVVWPEALGEHVLLALSVPSGRQVVYSLPKQAADDLSLSIPHVLEVMSRSGSG